MATLNEKQAALFTGRNWGVIATIREDGSPQATPVWIDYDGENVLARRRAAKRLRHGERTGNDRRGRRARAHQGSTWQDTYPYLGPGERRVIIQIRPERVDGYGAGG